MAVDSTMPEGGDSLRMMRLREMLTGFTFMAPALIIFTIFLIIPILVALYISFTDWNGISPLMEEGSFSWEGVENYNELLVNDGIRRNDFFKAVKNTLYFMLGVVPAQTALALVLAVIVNQRWLKAKGFFRTAFYFPSITSSVVISLIFLWLFSRGGLVNAGLQLLDDDIEPTTWVDDSTGVFHWIIKKSCGSGLVYDIVEASGTELCWQWEGEEGIRDRFDRPDWVREEYLGVSYWDWISGPSVTLFTIMLLNTWTTTGTLMIIFLAALQNIPPQVYEAAEIDGANQWQIFRRITLPLLRPTTFFVVTLGIIGTLQVFDQIFVISSGGPAKTTLTVAYLVYQFGFDRSDMGIATATAMLLFLIIFTLTLLQRRLIGGDKTSF
jgi:multiple sugar transport system permease protein